ncbi:MAG: hypothetical protein RPR91_06810, partial [Colwellia sp.]
PKPHINSYEHLGRITELLGMDEDVKLARKQADKNLTAIWHIYLNKNMWGSVTLDDIKALAVSKGLSVDSIDEVEFGYMPKIKGVLLKTNLGSALYPRQKLEDIELYNKNIKPNKNYEDFWSFVDWFLPAFITNGKISSAINQSNINVIDHKQLSTEILQNNFEHSLTFIYDFSNIIPITEQTLSKSKTISKHVPLIREAMFAFYSGMKIVAISSLIPIVENIISTIIEAHDSELTIIDKVNKCIDKANEKIISMHINDADWIPEEYIEISVLKVMNERVFILELIRSWLLNSFYANTKSYKSHSGFNRHIFAHAKSDLWQNPSNFFRAIGVIQAMAFIECFAVEGSKVSIFPPNHDERSESLRQEVFACLNFQAIKKQLIVSQQISNNLPFNPTSSDDGWLTRAAILSEKMNNEVVERLRNNNWDCHLISDPIKDGEYITVEAKKEDSLVKVALLYSCASSNKLYKYLAESFDYILYQGASYKQESYAYNVDAIIRPLNAWLAPE